MGTKIRRILIVLLAIVLSILSVYLIYRNKKTDSTAPVKESEETNEGVHLVESVPVEGVKDAGLYGDKLVVYKDNLFLAYELNGREIFQKEIVVEDYEVTFTENFIVLFTSETGYVRLMDGETNIVREVNFDERIVGIEEHKEFIMVHTKGETEKLYILDNKGELVETSDLEIRNILTYAHAKDYTTFAFSMISPNDYNDSRLVVLQPDDVIMYRKEFPEEMVLFTEFLDTHRLVVLTNNRIYFLNDFEGNTLWSYEIDFVKDIKVDDKKIFLLSGNSLKVYSLSGNIERQFAFVDNYDKISTLNDTVIAYSKNNIICLDGEKEVFRTRTKEDIVKLCQGKNSFVILFDNKLDFYEIVSGESS